VAVRIRLKRMGRRNRPFFRISVMDARCPRDGKSIEDIGYYDPMVREKSERVRINMERLEYWLSVGAQPTEKVAVLIKKVKLNRFGKPKDLPPQTPPKGVEPQESAASDAEQKADEAESTGESQARAEAEQEQGTEASEG